MEKQVRQSKPRIDLTNQRFGYLTPMYYIKGGKWHCKCDCGNEIDVDTRNLKTGHTKSCGCLKNKSKNVCDMTNYEDEYLKVLSREGSDEQQIALWKCLCKRCGNTFITRGSSIRAGYIKSCGCVHSQNEVNITKIFTENNIEFSTQYTFPDLKGNGRALRFDFAVFNNHTLSHLIEYNGEQHYKKVEGSWGENYELNQKYDELKKEYCKKNNIKLIIIKYDQQYSLKDLI
jgi:hypothetical protein